MGGAPVAQLEERASHTVARGLSPIRVLFLRVIPPLSHSFSCLFSKLSYQKKVQKRNRGAVSFKPVKVVTMQDQLCEKIEAERRVMCATHNQESAARSSEQFTQRTKKDNQKCLQIWETTWSRSSLHL